MRPLSIFTPPVRPPWNPSCSIHAWVSRASVADAPRIGDAAPLLAIGWMTLGGALAHAGWLGLPGSAAWGAGLAVPVLLTLLLQRRAAPDHR